MWAGADIEDREAVCLSVVARTGMRPEASMAGPASGCQSRPPTLVKELDAATYNSLTGGGAPGRPCPRAARAERDAETGTGIGLGVGFERGPGATLVAGVAVG